jgi:hypothetical protein
MSQTGMRCLSFRQPWLNLIIFALVGGLIGAI